VRMQQLQRQAWGASSNFTYTSCCQLLQNNMVEIPWITCVCTKAWACPHSRTWRYSDRSLP
jgi:hypothetical protein